MTISVSPWLVWAVLSLALFGVVFLWRVARDGWAWLVRDRVAPLLEDDPGCVCCEEGGRCYGVDPEECGQCGHPEPWHVSDLKLPPEQSAEELGFTTGAYLRLDAARERRAPWWEAEHRDAYESLGFDYPSGLMARVRELTP